MSTVGIVVAKEKSNRFPGKNFYPYKNEPLFWHSVKPLLESEYVDEVYVATNSSVVSDFCKQKNVKTIWRGPNIVDDEEPLLSVLKFSYQSIAREYNFIATIMANCPNHTVEDVNKAMEKISREELNEVRGFDKLGVETGLMIFKSSLVKSHFQISSHIGMIDSNGHEIHYIEDLKNLK